MPTTPKPYVGRFAPTPSGEMHFGSLVAALASYLDARQAQGHWWLRIENLDPPREVVGAEDAILRTLERYHLHWDGAVLHQSDRQAAYADQVAQWLQSGLAYACQCSRKSLEAYGEHYPGLCQNLMLAPSGNAIRLRVPSVIYRVNDRVQPAFEQNLAELGDFIIQRRDGYFAYQLAVVMDDILQGVNAVVRGADLLSSTPRQLYIYDLLGQPAPSYLHVPLQIQADGRKLSKSYRSMPITDADASRQMGKALHALGHDLPEELVGAPCPELLNWAVAAWNPERVPHQLVSDEPVEP